VGLRWGFKSEANAIARQIREELGLLPTAPLDPWRLAKYLAIPVVPLSSFAEDAPRALRRFAVLDRSAFSAVTVFRGLRRMIVHNDSHSRYRQGSDISHELAHGLLLHPPTPPLDQMGLRSLDRDIEDEADWLSGALLISDEAALEIVRRSWPQDEAMKRFRVSEPMLRFRINVTGARRRIGA